MATWSHMVTRTVMGKNNDKMKIALKITGHCAAPYIFHFNYKRMHFQIFMVCEIPGMVLVGNILKNILSLFLRK